MPMLTSLRTRRSRLLRLVLAVTAVLLFGGCDSSDTPNAQATPSPSPSPQPLTREEYINQATLLCQASKNATPGPVPSTAAEFAAAVKRDIERQRELHGKLRALVPPVDDREVIEREFLDVKEKGIKMLENALPQVEGIAATGDLKGAQTAIFPIYAEVSRLDQSAEPFLSSYGLGACL
jgi:hypothetical protein